MPWYGSIVGGVGVSSRKTDIENSIGVKRIKHWQYDDDICRNEGVSAAFATQYRKIAPCRRASSLAYTLNAHHSANIELVECLPQLPFGGADAQAALIHEGDLRYILQRGLFKPGYHCDIVFARVGTCKVHMES